MTDTSHANQPMSVATALESRRSIRGFRAQPVAQATLEKIFAMAQQAPSNCNIQPWHTYVASGELKAALSQKLLAAATGGTPPAPDFPYPGRFEGSYRQRQVDCAAALYGEMGIKREDKAGRARAMLRNLEFFDAPHVAFICMDAGFGATVALDIGIYLQSLMLAMTAEGIGSCAQGALRHYPDLVRETLEIPSHHKILVGISFGYEDPEVPANRTRVGRETLDKNVIFKSR